LLLEPYAQIRSVAQKMKIDSILIDEVHYMCSFHPRYTHERTFEPPKPRRSLIERFLGYLSGRTTA